MIHNWKIPDSFKRHMDDMDSFRRAHAHLTPEEQLKKAQAVQIPGNNDLPCLTDPAHYFTDDRGKIIVVPIWEISPPRDSQN